MAHFCAPPAGLHPPAAAVCQPSGPQPLGAGGVGACGGCATGLLTCAAKRAPCSGLALTPSTHPHSSGLPFSAPPCLASHLGCPQRHYSGVADIYEDRLRLFAVTAGGRGLEVSGGGCGVAVAGGAWLGVLVCVCGWGVGAASQPSSPGGCGAGEASQCVCSCASIILMPQATPLPCVCFPALP